MKRFSTITFFLLLAVVFSLPVSVSAATSPGIKPGSFFYFLDTTFERISLFFTLNPEKKARKALEYADERLAEIEAIAGEKNSNAVITAIADYKNNIALATEKSKEVKDKGQAESLLASIEDGSSKNQEVLSAVLIKVPDEAKEAITQAIEVSRKGQKEATKQITELKDEVEQLKKEVAGFKSKDEAKIKTSEESSNQKSKDISAPIKSQISTELSEIRQLRKEVTDLKKQVDVTGQSTRGANLDGQTIPAQIIQPPTIKVQPVVSVPPQDFKPQILTILNAAKDNWVKLNNFSRECVSMVVQRKTDIQGLVTTDRATFFSNGPFGSTMTDAWTLLYDIVDNGVSAMNDYQTKCEVFIGVGNANIKLIDNSIATIQNSVGSMTSTQLTAYQSNYFGTDQYGSNRAVIQNLIDRVNKFIAVNDAQYRQVLTFIGKYIDRATTPTALPPTQYIPPTLYVPQLPQFTRCTISGDGGVGLQAYVNCTTSSF
jgi:hypothetical protein